MAALLCSSIGKMCSALCDGVTMIVSIPCKLCGVTCHHLGAALRGDFCFFNSVVLSTSLPPMFMTICALFLQPGGGCTEYKWLYIDSVFCLLNIVASFYITHEIEKQNDTSGSAGGGGGGDYIPIATPVDPEEGYKATGTTAAPMTGKPIPAYVPPQTPLTQAFVPNTNTSPHNDPNAPSAGSLNRVKGVLCNDPWVALYILILVAFSVWQVMGITGLSGKAKGCTDSNDVSTQMVLSIICGFIFIFLGLCAFVSSLCCSVSRRNFRRN